MEIVLFTCIILLAIQVIVLIRMYDKDTTELNQIILKQTKENAMLKISIEALNEALDMSMKTNMEKIVEEEKKKNRRKKTK